jgi:hypothetical protein
MSADRREALLNAIEASENGELEPIVEKEIETNEPEIQAQDDSQNTPERDEKGRFVSKDKEETVASEETMQASDDDTELETESEREAQKPALSRPTTWKKEYLPIWDKLTSGEQLSPEEALKLAEYSNQRESEYKKGVSTYRAEAQRANELVKVLEPYMGELQKNNIAPAQFVNNLAAAHYRLATGTPEQKIEMFHRLAQDYGIQLNQAGQFQPQDAYTQQLMQQLQAINQEVGTIKSRYEQEENSRLVDEIEKHRQDAEHYPHFDEVRETMAQLLEQGLATDLTTAYAKAVRLNDEVWAKEQNRLLQKAQNDAKKQQQVAKAKAKAVSPRSVTPSGLVDASDKKDRKSLLAQNFSDFNDRY